jgi:hypothetical protein
MLQVSDGGTHDAKRDRRNNVPLTQVRTWLSGPPRACDVHLLEEGRWALDVLLWDRSPATQISNCPRPVDRW